MDTNALFQPAQIIKVDSVETNWNARPESLFQFIRYSITGYMWVFITFMVGTHINGPVHQGSVVGSFVVPGIKTAARGIKQLDVRHG